MRVDHGADEVTVRMGFTDLRKKSDAGPASIAILTDTRKTRKGRSSASAVASRTAPTTKTDAGEGLDGLGSD